MKKIKVYTDGGCDRNPGGIGGWAVRLLDGEQAVENSGREDKTTNNRMELTAAIRALELLIDYCRDQKCEIELYTDSQYLARGMSEWIVKWQLSQWTLKDGSQVKNLDLWKHLVELEHAVGQRIDWKWVQGHAGDPNNMRVDRLVQEAIQGRVSSSTGKKGSITAPMSAPLEVKLIKQGKHPAAVSVSQKVPVSRSLRIEWQYLQQLIEDLLRAQRQGDES